MEILLRRLWSGREVWVQGNVKLVLEKLTKAVFMLVRQSVAGIELDIT
jgi:hypothetical protein